jgi:hypothetical protein
MDKPAGVRGTARPAGREFLLNAAATRASNGQMRNMKKLLLALLAVAAVMAFAPQAEAGSRRYYSRYNDHCYSRSYSRVYYNSYPRYYPSYSCYTPRVYYSHGYCAPRYYSYYSRPRFAISFGF